MDGKIRLGEVEGCVRCEVPPPCRLASGPFTPLPPSLPFWTEHHGASPGDQKVGYCQVEK